MTERILEPKIKIHFGFTTEPNSLHHFRLITLEILFESDGTEKGGGPNGRILLIRINNLQNKIEIDFSASYSIIKFKGILLIFDEVGREKN